MVVVQRPTWGMGTWLLKVLGAPHSGAHRFCHASGTSVYSRADFDAQGLGFG